MARSIDEIMSGLIAAKESQPALAVLDSHSVTAVWRLLLYVVAMGCHVVEMLYDEHVKEVDGVLATRLPHRAKWYCDKTLQFMSDMSLVSDSDYYDISQMSDAEIDKARVVKHAVAVEDGRTSMLTIKVAGENSEGERVPLADEHVRQLTAYLGEVKDAGVKINVVNKRADMFSCAIDVYYDAMREGAHIHNACDSVINDYISNLPFNGEYSNMALVDRLQKVNGVKIVEFNGASAQEDGVAAATPINARYTPIAGYFKANNINIKMQVYD
ncbi:MAG: hypothetical protein RR706_09645 [Muribaculaceae bacterium]